MQFKKSAVAATVEAPKKLATEETPKAYVASKGRDFDAEARGKTRCALEEAWAQSPLLPMIVKDPTDFAQIHAALDTLITERMKRVFPNG
jgi:hypothetical protein